jgi:hypothetical protein
MVCGSKPEGGAGGGENCPEIENKTRISNKWASAIYGLYP